MNEKHKKYAVAAITMLLLGCGSWYYLKMTLERVSARSLTLDRIETVKSDGREFSLGIKKYADFKAAYILRDAKSGEVVDILTVDNGFLEEPTEKVVRAGKDYLVVRELTQEGTGFLEHADVLYSIEDSGLLKILQYPSQGTCSTTDASKGNFESALQITDGDKVVGVVYTFTINNGGTAETATKRVLFSLVQNTKTDEAVYSLNEGDSQLKTLPQFSDLCSPKGYQALLK